LKAHAGDHFVAAVEKHAQVNFDETLVSQILACPSLSYDADNRVISFKAFLLELDTVLKFLERNRGPHTLGTVKTQTKVALESLQDQIHQCPKIAFDPVEQKLSYQPKYDVLNQEGLLQCLKEQRGGVLLTDLQDGYVGLEQDLEELVAKNDVLSVFNPDLRTFVLFYRDKTEELQLTVDDKLRTLWSEIVMPNSKNDLDRKLLSLGHLSRAEMGERSSVGVVTSKKQRRVNPDIKRRRMVLTNTHLLDTLPWLKAS